VKLVDSHCHLDDEKFAADFDAVVERARAAGVDRMMAIGTGDGPPDLEVAVRLADRHDCFYATIGVHPHDAAKATAASFDRLRELAAHPKVLAIGEIGLDYHYDFSPREVQREVFREQLRLAGNAGKPVVIHTREAWDDTLSLLDEHRPRALVMHCFTGGEDEARQCLDRGFYLSFGGVLTFPKAENVRQAARIVPEDRLLVETDAPYLAPVPHRGKRNEPAFLVDTVRKLAEVRGVDAAHLAQVTTSNFERLFGLRRE
jgi:TatD DNase family protein